MKLKPLVLWCRWHEATLRLHGRDETSVWGELVFADEAEAFSFDLDTRRLTIGEESEARQLQLDSMGVEVEERSAT